MRTKHLPRINPAVSTPADRQRFTIAADEYDDGYGTPYRWENVRADPNGRSLSSLLPDGRHAPVLDVDNVVTKRVVNGRAAVEFHGPYRRSKVVKGLAVLLREPDLIAPETVLEIAALDSVHGFTRLRRVWDVTVTFPYDVEIVPSKTAGHFHLLCQTSLEWEDAIKLAKLLGAAGLTDHHHSTISGRGNFMYVNQPL